jgi:Lon protease-like protein
MFPLGSVLLPGMVLPLHVFEPRYRQLMRDLGPSGEFGVVMIERGHEVGGGDIRADLGAVAQIVESEELDDGRWLVVAVGTRRIRVVSWAPDDPYPVADVEDWPDAPEDVDLRPVRLGLDRILALAERLGVDVVDADLSPSPVEAIYQAAIMAPLGPVDRLRLLACDGVAARADLLVQQLADLEDVLRFQLDTD